MPCAPPSRRLPQLPRFSAGAAGRVAGLFIGLAVTSGCQRPGFLTEADFHHYRELGLPESVERGAAFRADAPSIPAPTTTEDLDREPRYLSLAEAVAVALEQGTVGIQSLTAPGQANDNPAPGGRDDAIRVLALDPAIAGADIEASLARFDARWISGMTWTTTDRPVGTPLDVSVAGNRTTIASQNASFQSALLKPLATGGLAGVTFRTDYEYTNLPARVNPAYQPVLQFQFEQPLLQGFGVEINQLRTDHPGSLLTPFASAAHREGILITRLRFDRRRAEFERALNHLLLNVEAAYWNLYAAYGTLYSREEGLRQVYETWLINQALHESGRLPAADLAQTRGQYELFRERRLAALGQVLESEKQLRGLMGLPVEDGRRLVPIDQPTLAPYKPDWIVALHEAMNDRPELVEAGEDLKLRQLDLIRQKNLLLPDLRFFSTYDYNALGSRLDGPQPEGALAGLSSNRFHNWSLGLRLDVPIGFREAHAGVRSARLALAQSYLDWQDRQAKVQRQLAQEYRHVVEYHGRLQAVRARREAFGQELDSRFREYRAGRGSLNVLLEAQRFWSQALADEFTMIAQYNSALAAFEFAKGTILRHDNVQIAEGPLPPCAQARAVEHERERSAALVLCERAEPVADRPAAARPRWPFLPELPAVSAPSLPALFQHSPGATGLPEHLPIPEGPPEEFEESPPLVVRPRG